VFATGSLASKLSQFDEKLSQFDEAAFGAGGGGAAEGDLKADLWYWSSAEGAYQGLADTIVQFDQF